MKLLNFVPFICKTIGYLLGVAMDFLLKLIL